MFYETHKQRLKLKPRKSSNIQKLSRCLLASEVEQTGNKYANPKMSENSKKTCPIIMVPQTFARKTERKQMSTKVLKRMLNLYLTACKEHTPKDTCLLRAVRS